MDRSAGGGSDAETVSAGVAASPNRSSAVEDAGGVEDWVASDVAADDAPADDAPAVFPSSGINSLWLMPVNFSK